MIGLGPHHVTAEQFAGVSGRATHRVTITGLSLSPASRAGLWTVPVSRWVRARCCAGCYRSKYEIGPGRIPVSRW